VVLGRYGTAHAIPALKEIGKGELGASMPLAKTARDAMARIQARVQAERSAMTGGLALVDPEGGGDLSFSDSGAGSLSPPQE
jgi:hypothetical protein